MELDINDRDFYRPECRYIGPCCMNICICIVTNVASCLLFFKCESNNENK